MSDRETRLMLAVKEGSAEAFRELYELYRKPLANFLYRLCWDSSLVEDLLQEVFLRVWRARGSYQPQAKVSTYLFRIAANLWINESAKRRERSSELAEGVVGDAVSESLERSEIQKAVRQAIGELPEGERICLILSEYNGLKYAQIAEVLGIPVGTVKSRMYSAIQRLKELLKSHEV
ncbi:MAG: sigma-70 family RNA polymerase sigma factor [Planctomycetes bacterium]|nr:sigma-70 family RNA polymerase sigma factor [Planctomycetota bacterium]